VFLSYYNSVLAGLTIGHWLDLAIGPSIDSIAALSAGASADGAGIEAIGGTSIGAHARIAAILGTRPTHDARRMGLSVSLDVHPTFIQDTVLMTIALGIGGEFY
jgi:hypothetical protein